ncbi:hypothetical protein EPI10_028638 [Gossypium australe]|uniref:Uncharacterized protein n=1 Tax=Gossypium australe TaxID=47621 RepID=A0A5B6UZ64_9ROSI|nr:hypothetical protein EPI10_028638 [Gossypium australe]
MPILATSKTYAYEVPIRIAPLVLFPILPLRWKSHFLLERQVEKLYCSSKGVMDDGERDAMVYNGKGCGEVKCKVWTLRWRKNIALRHMRYPHLGKKNIAREATEEL